MNTTTTVPDGSPSVFTFTVSRNSLLTALQHTRLAILKQNAIPCFGNFFLTFDEEERLMTVHTSSGELWMTETVILDEVKGNRRSISIYWHDLLPAIKALDDQPLRFDVGEMQLTVHHSIGFFRLPLCNDAKEFLGWCAPSPDIEADDCHSMSYEAPVLASILNRCSYAMAQDCLRPAMNGVNFNLTEDYADYTATNGQIIVRVRKRPVCYDNTTTITTFIMPARVSGILQRVLPRTGDVDIEYQEKMEKTVKPGVTETVHRASCRITIDDTLTLSFWPTEGRYPNYLAVIPDSHSYEMAIDRKALTKSLDRLSLFANESSEMVRMDITTNTVKLRTEDCDFYLEGEETLPCECDRDNISLRIGMKVRNLSRTLKTMSTEKVSFLLQNSSRAVIINPQPQPDNEELTYLIMPMLCND